MISEALGMDTPRWGQHPHTTIDLSIEVHRKIALAACFGIDIQSQKTGLFGDCELELYTTLRLEGS